MTKTNLTCFRLMQGVGLSCVFELNAYTVMDVSEIKTFLKGCTYWPNYEIVVLCCLTRQSDHSNRTGLFFMMCGLIDGVAELLP